MALHDDDDYEPYDPDEDDGDYDGPPPDADDESDECDINCTGCPSMADDENDFLEKVRCFTHRLAEEMSDKGDHSQIDESTTSPLTGARLTLAKYLLYAASELMIDTISADLEDLDLGDLATEEIGDSLELKQKELFELLDKAAGASYGSAGRWLEHEVHRIETRERVYQHETELRAAKQAESLYRIHQN